MSSSPVNGHSPPSTALQLYNANSDSSPLNPSRTDSFAQRFIIPTKADPLSSGFPYHPRLHDMNVSLDEWHHFTSEILTAGKLSIKEDYAAWSTGIVTGTLTSPFLLFFGPWAGYAAGKSVHSKVVVTKVKERLLRDGDMRSVLRRWNESTFARKGFQAWLELPVEGNLGDLDTRPGMEEKRSRREKKEQKKADKKEKRRFKIVFIPENDRQAFPWQSGSAVQTPAQAQAIPFAEAPQAEHRSPMEMPLGSSDHIQPLVNHKQLMNSSTVGDIKYEYRSVPPEVNPARDTRLPNVSAAEGSQSPLTEVANGRIPESEVIPEDEKKNTKSPYHQSAAFEMDGS